MNSAGTIWWTKVPAAVKLLREAQEALESRKSVEIVSEYISQDFIEALSYSFKENLDNNNTPIYSLDLATLSDANTITDGIADQLAIGFMKKRTIANLREELPEGGCVWILENMTPERHKELSKLLGHADKCKANIAFVFEYVGPDRIDACYQAKLSFSKLDLQYYAWTLLLGRLPDYILEYASQLAVELSQNQPTQCAILCEKIKQCLAHPEVVCTWLTEGEIKAGIHTAQVRSIEPCIEYGRVFLINSMIDRVSAVLPFTDEYGTLFSNPIEVELRGLVYHKNQLYLSETENSLLSMLYNARNTVSHLGILSYQDVETLLKNSTKW